MITVTCVRCKMEFGLSDHFYKTAKQTEQEFWCPAGHGQHFVLGKTEAEKLRDEVEALRRERDRARQQVARVEDERDHEKRRAAAFKGMTTKMKKRVEAGVCPCCNRHFENLERHMKTKHPGELDERIRVIDGGKA